MKKTIIAAVAALFIGFGANAQSVNENEATVADVVAELNQADALQFIPMYQKMLADIENVCRADINDESRTNTPRSSAQYWLQHRTRLPSTAYRWITSTAA